EPERGHTFDGIVCIGGEDWWYHNRGHFDFQIMRRLAERWPVLFVNSLGVRMPSLKDNRLFLQRIGRKLKSLGNGLVNVENQFWVFSPVMVPGAAGHKLSSWALGPQIRLAAAHAGIRNPILWVHCPAGASLAGEYASAANVLQRTDRFEAFPEADPTVIGAQIDHLKAKADLVIYASPSLMASESASVRRQALVTHGVDLEMFTQAGSPTTPTPAEIAHVGRPRIGFIGGIDAHTFDIDLFLGVARAMPTHQFVMVGGCSLPDGWCGLPNVHFTGRKPYDSIAGYMAAMDVLIMPWNRSEWIKACNPIKLKEYLAVGRQVVTTDFPALDPWRDVVRTAGTVPEFVNAIQGALAQPLGDRGDIQRRLTLETWDAKAADVRRALFGLGLSYADATSRRRGAA
ncbi:MAG: glycosyltransferase, partial [Hyphomicrobiaceae bacterium]